MVGWGGGGGAAELWGRNSWERQQHDMSEELRRVQVAGDSRAGHMAKVRAGSYMDLCQDSLSYLTAEWSRCYL